MKDKMKKFTLLALILTMNPVMSHAATQELPHFDLNMTTREYRRHLETLKHNKDVQGKDEPSISYAISLGERLSKWIEKVNTARSPDHAIRLTSPLTRRSNPIDKPNTYSPSIIKTDTDKILANMPSEMKSVLIASTPLEDKLPVDDELFITHARLLDRNYQSAARYKSLNGWRSAYIGAAKKDVRGHYYLTKNKIDTEVLKNVTSIESEKVSPIKEALIQICKNSAFFTSNCSARLEDAWKKNEASAFYSKYYPASKKLWDSFFKIPKNARRKDVSWIKNSMRVPFNTPEIAKFIPYLQDNIQDEFRFQDWKLLINFGTFSNGPRLKFEGGVVPHVNGLGGNEIVMDANQPIEEYESQWTIRHEFGHVIGLPDCYHEFYDVKLQAYVNYQLDVTDLMCSRAGNMNQRIYEELKGAYSVKK